MTSIAQIFSTILGIIAVIFIAYFASSLKRFILAVLIAFVISVAVFTGLELGLGTFLPDWIIPIFMIIATAIELRREAVERQQKNMPDKQEN